MKVGLLCVGWPGRAEVGGAARYAWRLGEVLRTKVDLHVITSSGGTPLPGATMHYLENRDSRFDHYYLFPWRVRRELRNLDLDVLHAFGDDWALSPGDFGWVRTFHGSSLSEARSSRGLRKANHYVLSLLEHSVRRRCDYAIAVGPESSKEFNTDSLIPPVVPRKNLGPGSKPTRHATVVYIGMWEGRKRGRFAAESVQKAAEQLRRPIELHVVGPKEDAHFWQESAIHHADLQDEEVLALIAESWVLIAPSTYEGFGIPAFEALSLGVKSISTPNPGSRYLATLVNDTKLFRLAEDSDLPSILAEAIRSGPVQGTKQSVRGAAIAAELAEEASVEHLVEIYKKASSSALAPESRG